MRAYDRIETPGGTTTVLPGIDFETYSEAGLIWSESDRKWLKPKGATQGSIQAVGAPAYARHPTTEVLILCYDMKDGFGVRTWLPGMPPPKALLDWIAGGGIVIAWNCPFEEEIWNQVCVPRYGFPMLATEQVRDAAAHSRAFSMPGKLEKAAEVLETDVQKMKEGKTLMKRFSVPRNPTKNDASLRVRPEDDPVKFDRYISYCADDVRTEAAISNRIPELSGFELEFWYWTKRMNSRGVKLDRGLVDGAVRILDDSLERNDAEIREITGGAVEKTSELAKLKAWLESRGIETGSLDKTGVSELMIRPLLPPDCRRALELRQFSGSAGVKKYYAMQRQMCPDERVRDLFFYHGARTGRDTGADIQPQNLTKEGPDVVLCGGCGKHHGARHSVCPRCLAPRTADAEPWSHAAVNDAAEAVRAGDANLVSAIYGDPILTLSGCVRGSFVADDGMDLICSDYSAVEAAGTAMLAGEEWRIQAFRDRQDIYLVSASRITGIPYDAYKAWPESHGTKHPDRQKIGKPAELGLGFGGWVNAWRNFDKTDNFTDAQIRENIVAWRGASPAIVELWGGQKRGLPWEPSASVYFGLEGMAVQAVMNPGTVFPYRMISFQVRSDILFMRLPSGRELKYHSPRLKKVANRWGIESFELTYMTWNTNPDMGPIGWVCMKTYGGRLTENAVQATCRDLLAYAAVNLERAGYRIVLRVHDELVAEVPKGFGSVEEFERIMATLPDWASDWPVRASGGWRGFRYRKD